MTDNDGATWPMPKFRFLVDLGNDLKEVSFQEVSGMDIQDRVIEYRKSSSPIFAAKKMPDIAKYGNVTMKRGVFVNNSTFWNWLSQVKMNIVKRGTVTIKLLNEADTITMQWTLTNAWPTKITGTDLKADGNEVAIDTLEIAYEQLIIANGQADK